jgi:hypothetical protein
LSWTNSLYIEMKYEEKALIVDERPFYGDLCVLIINQTLFCHRQTMSKVLQNAAIAMPPLITESVASRRPGQNRVREIQRQLPALWATAARHPGKRVH